MSKYFFDIGGSANSNNTSFFRNLANQYLQQQQASYHPDFVSDLPISNNNYLEDSNAFINNIEEQAKSYIKDEATNIYYNREIRSIFDKQNYARSLGTAEGQNMLFNKYDLKGQVMQQRQDEENNAIMLQATHYGFADDPYIDTNSLNGIGNRNNKLTANTSVALSKETANRLGIKGGEELLVTLPSGEQRQVTYDDTIPSGYKKERIDFYTPDGKLSFDGKNVQVEVIK